MRVVGRSCAFVSDSPERSITFNSFCRFYFCGTEWTFVGKRRSKMVYKIFLRHSDMNCYYVIGYNIGMYVKSRALFTQIISALSDTFPSCEYDDDEFGTVA